MASVTPPFRPGVPISGDIPLRSSDSAHKNWVRTIAERVNKMLSGSLNVVAKLTLATPATTTNLEDARISSTSALILQPLTANAAAALYSATSVLQGTPMNGQVTFTHGAGLPSDCSFNLLIIG